MCAALVVVVCLLSSAGAQVTDPTEQNRIQACGNLQPAACQIAKGCRFCRSRWGQSQCFSANQVSSLPGGLALVVPLCSTCAVPVSFNVHAREYLQHISDQSWYGA